LFAAGLDHEIVTNSAKNPGRCGAIPTSRE
jgi:hypothetical protein